MSGVNSISSVISRYSNFKLTKYECTFAFGCYPISFCIDFK